MRKGCGYRLCSHLLPALVLLVTGCAATPRATGNEVTVLSDEANANEE